MRPDKIQLRVRSVMITLSQRVAHSEVYAFKNSDAGYVLERKALLGWRIVREGARKYYGTQQAAEMAGARYLQRAVANAGTSHKFGNGVTSLLTLDGVERI